MLFGKKFDFVFSLGENCAAAMYLRKFKLRDMSSPFDWVCNVPLIDRVDLLLNNFSGFLERENLVKISKMEGGDPKHDYYHDKKSGFKFYHDFPAMIPLEQSFPEVKSKYDRRIARLIARLQHAHRVLCIWSGYEIETSDEDLVLAVKKMGEKFPNADFCLLATESDMRLPRECKYSITGNVIRYKGPFLPDKNYTWGDMALLSKIYSRINRNLMPIVYSAIAMVYKRIKTRTSVVKYLFGIPIYKRKIKQAKDF
jgi:hypothetical protein